MLVKLRADLADAVGPDRPFFRDDEGVPPDYRRVLDAVAGRSRRVWG